jgi:hypothetical protein
MTFWNNKTHNFEGFSYTFNDSQGAWIGNTSDNMGNTDGFFLNESENQCTNGSGAYNCGGTPTFYDTTYQAIMGNSLNGQGENGNFAIIRISAGSYGVLENNTLQNTTTSGFDAVEKHHCGNKNSQETWTGNYCQFWVESDNHWTGPSDAQLVELAPQNGVTDERLQNFVFERNLITWVSGGSCRVIVSVQNFSARDNVWNCGNSSGSAYGIQIAKRGVEWVYTSGAPVNTLEPQYAEIYNNTFNGNVAIGFNGSPGMNTAGNNGYAANNLMYSTGGGSPVNNAGSGNSVSNNTATVTNNPSFTNGSGLFDIISDFKPTANYTGGIGTQQPVFFDALGVSWTLPYDLGAIHH